MPAEAFEEVLPGRLASGEVVRITPAVANTRFELGYEASQSGVALEARAIWLNVPPECVWEQVAAIGGKNGWYYADWAWTVRGWLDWLLRGIGNRRERRQALAVGDRLDTWVVERHEPGRDLTLRSEMRLPKLARMGLHVRPRGSGSVLVQWVEFHPNLLTWLYWWATYPIHRLIFRGLVRAIARRAEASTPGASVHIRP